MIRLIVDRKSSQEGGPIVKDPKNPKGPSYFLSLAVVCDDYPAASVDNFMVSKEIFDKARVGEDLKV